MPTGNFVSFPKGLFYILRMLQDLWPCENEISHMGYGGYLAGAAYIGAGRSRNDSNITWLK